MENGLQSSKTECGESSQEAITEGGGEMARWDKDNGVASGSGQRSIEKVKWQDADWLAVPKEGSEQTPRIQAAG